MYMGPIWDYNLAFGNADYCEGSSISGWAWDFNKVCGEDYWQVPFWWYRFRQDTKFTSALADRWRTLRQGTLKTENLMKYIDSTAQVLDESQQRNFQRWDILGIYIWPNNYIGYTYAAEVNYLKQWITQRTQWIDDNIAKLEDITATEEILLEPTGGYIDAFPNPFEESVDVEIQSMPNSNWKATIYDEKGQLVRKDLSLQSNRHNAIFHWDGRNDAGIKVSKGLYLFRISDSKSATTTVKLVKY